MKKLLTRICAFFIALVLVFTGVSIDSRMVEAKSVKPTKMSPSKTNATLEVGSKMTLKVKTVSPKKASKAVKWSTSNKKIATVTQKGVVTAKKQGTAKITAQSKVNKKLKKTCKVKVVKKAAATISREQWVGQLMKKLGYEAVSGETHFNDISSSKYASEIETAFIYGILPYRKIDGSGQVNFNPKSPVTREFAAYTALKASGYANSGNLLNCKDSEDLRTKEEDATAVEVGLIGLKNNKFEPQKNLTGKEADQI